MGRLGDAPELIGAALLLLSPVAGSFITGRSDLRRRRLHGNDHLTKGGRRRAEGGSRTEKYTDVVRVTTAIFRKWVKRVGFAFHLPHSPFPLSSMPHTFVIFGASGDLTHRKLMPALYQLFRKGRLPKETRIVGFSRTAFTHDAWRSDLAKAVARYVGNDFDTGPVGPVFATHLLPSGRHWPGRRFLNSRQVAGRY